MSTSEYDDNILQEMELVDFTVPELKKCASTAAKIGALCTPTGAAIFQGGAEISQRLGGRMWVEMTAAAISAPAIAIGVMGLTAAGIESVRYQKAKREAKILYNIDKL